MGAEMLDDGVEEGKDEAGRDQTENAEERPVAGNLPLLGTHGLAFNRRLPD